MKPPKAMIHSAGGLVIARERVLITHHSKKDSWELPKGRVEHGESFEQTALREVLEETGYQCRCEEALPPVFYVTPAGNSKCVHFWRMSVVRDALTWPPDRSFDRILWCYPQDAIRLLRHHHQRELIAKYGQS